MDNVVASFLTYPSRRRQSLTGWPGQTLGENNNVVTTHKVTRPVRDLLQLFTAAKERIEQSAACEVRTHLINTAKNRPHYYV